MPKKKSIKGSANEFKTEADKILAFLTKTGGGSSSVQVLRDDLVEVHD
jgi:hypothetical protein